jgi:hypothetical protein
LAQLIFYTYLGGIIQSGSTFRELIMSRLLRSDYKIEKRGSANCAVFHLPDPKAKGYDEMVGPDGRVKHVEHIDPTAVFDEEALRARIQMVEAGGRSAALEKAALYALQRMDQMGVKK